ncbi:MAG: NAD-dependent epimerase/dehydratase family protein [Spirochaetales bacterium]|nr:NAD-dependent epimerase/dehydratase family protein [Leptospiraceae bacterium]MCP5481626.1 NAD-dependent epimerase/dehydratase family protein [Spirochaetales bacterium]MCP5484454.1 NAD-dependent epimerase/dehydratase family protein [Spirochaetales bacterium]
MARETAVIGATGMIGHHTAREIQSAGHRLRVIHRQGSRLEQLADLAPYESRVADLDDTAGLIHALQGCDGVVNCAGYYPTVPRPWREDVKRGLDQMENFYRACDEAGLRRIVYVGGAIALQKNPTGAPGHEGLEYVAQPENRNPYVQVKWAMDDLAMRKARAGLPVMIGIPAMTIGEFDYGPTTGAFVVETANGTLPGYVNGRRNVIYAGDAGRGLLAVLERGQPGRRYLLTGQNMELAELIQMIAEQAGVVRPPRALPLGLVRLVGALQSLRYRLKLGPPPKISKTAIAVMAAGQFLSGERAARDLGFEAQVSVEEAVTRALSWFREIGYIKE